MHVNEITKRKKLNDFHNNTNVSLVHKYVYFAVDKVANSTIKQSLFEVEYLPVKKSIVTLYDPRCSPLLSPYQLPSEMFDDIMSKGSEYFKFAFVRNPYSRLLSCYLDRILTISSTPSKQFRRYINGMHLKSGDLTFKMFAEAICKQKPAEQNSHWRVQSDDILFDLYDFDHIAKFEKIWDEMEFISKKIYGKVLPQMKNRNINSSPKKTDSDKKLLEYYDQELADLVYDKFKADFINFNYERLII